MEAQNYLGIYLSRDAATVVCLGPWGRDRDVVGCFSVSTEGQEQPSLKGLAALITKGCAERELKFSEVAVALDCAMFMQHSLRSEFNDPKQIAATVRFDTEEALAMDITDVAIAFKIVSARGRLALAVFTAQRRILSDVLFSLQANNIDPVTMEPDVNCLSRFICRNISLPEDSRPFFGLLSRRSGYFIVPSLSVGAASHSRSAMRTIFLGPTQNSSELLAREVPLTCALIGTGEPVNCLKVFDSAGSVDYRRLSEKLGLEAAPVDLVEAARTDPQVLADCAGPVDFAIAYGAALAHLERAQAVDFRSDFMPYQGKKLRLQKALKFLSISVTVLVLAVGVYVQMRLLQRNRYRARLSEKFTRQYSAVMLGKKPQPKSDPVRRLAGELRRIRDVKSGQLSVTGEESVSAKLTRLLKAFNECAAETDLKIESIAITAKTISVVGDTSSRKNTLRLFEAIKKGKLEILQQRLYSKAGRDNFRISVVPKK